MIAACRLEVIVVGTVGNVLRGGQWWGFRASGRAASLVASADFSRLRGGWRRAARFFIFAYVISFHLSIPCVRGSGLRIERAGPRGRDDYETARGTPMAFTRLVIGFLEVPTGTYPHMTDHLHLV